MAVFANVSAVRAVVDISSAMGVAATRSGDSGCGRWATSSTTAPSSTVFGENTPPPHGEACSGHISVSASAVSIAMTSGSGGFGCGSRVNRRDNPSFGRSGRLGGAGISGGGAGGFGGRSLAGFIGTPRPRKTTSPSPSHCSRAGCCCKSSFPFAFPSMHNATIIASASDSFSPTSFSTVVVASRTSPGFGGGGGGACGFPRDMVVRCELAATGSAGDSYSLSEPKMESKVRGACFYAVTAFGAIILFVLMLVGHPFVLMFDRHRRKFQHFVAKVWAALTVAPFYKIKFEGLENLPPPDTPAVYVSNHQSFLDIYTLLTLGRGFKFISKTQIFLFPIIGWAMFLLGTIPLKRMDSRSQLDCLKRCMDLIKKGASVFFFPEGTRSKDGKLGAFKKGAFSVAAKTKAPVVPITLIGTGQIMPPGREGIVNFGSVKVVIHKTIDGNDPDMLCKEARKMIASGLTQS